MSPSLDGTMPENCDITREQLSIDFVHIISIFVFFLDINSPVDQVQS